GGGERIRYRREEEYWEHFRELFREAVRCRLRSEKPAGISLSGGMDSGSVASMAGWLRARGEAGCRELRAYCWAFKELKECDEREISDEIVRHYGIALTEVDAEEAWPLKGYPEHGPHRDEPYFGVYQALIEKTLAIARDDGVVNVFYGDRGDLTMGFGLLDFPGLLASGNLRAFLKDLKRYAASTGDSQLRVFKSLVIKALPAYLWPYYRLSRLRARMKFWQKGSRATLTRLPSWIGPAFSHTNFNPEPQREDGIPIKDPACRKRRSLIFHPFQLQGSVWSERTCAMYRCGFTEPWSDRRMADVAVAVPQWILNRSGDPKRLVRAAMAGIMPEKARLSARKILPTPFFEQALRRDAIQTVQDLVTDMVADCLGYVNQSVLQEQYLAIRNGG